ncbi:MAG: hypothetical protein ABIR96_09640 [Bdellovibrionota bacterium]
MRKMDVDRLGMNERPSPNAIQKLAFLEGAVRGSRETRENAKLDAGKFSTASSQVGHGELYLVDFEDVVFSLRDGRKFEH